MIRKNNNLYSGKSGIYCFENMKNNKKYVGKAVNIDRRIKAHLSYLRKNKDESLYLQNAWNKYGEESFSIYVIEECPIEEIGRKEIYYINKLNSKRPNGYNLTDGGDGTLGYKITEEQREKRRINGRKQYHPRGNSSPLFGRKLSIETIDKMKNRKKVFGKDHNNFGTKSGKTSIYYNVRKISIKHNVYWQANVKIEGKSRHIGNYKTEMEAAIGFDKFIISNSLPNPTNFPKILYFFNFCILFKVLDTIKRKFK